MAEEMKEDNKGKKRRGSEPGEWKEEREGKGIGRECSGVEMKAKIRKGGKWS